jgi:hypothetical protein
VIGWERYEGAISLLPRYDERVATIPTTKGKLDALANAAGILQSQIDDVRQQVVQIRGEKANFEYVSKSLIHHADLIDQIGALAADSDSRIRAIQFGFAGANPRLDDLKQEVDKFKEAACPVLRTTRMGDITRMNLDSACGLH